MASAGGGAQRFVPMVTVLERGDATDAGYWTGLPTRNLMSERQKCAPRCKLSKEHLVGMC